MGFRFTRLARLAISFCFALVQAGTAAPSVENLVQMKCGARIECITPDGQNGRVSKLADPAAATALISDDDTVTCLLREGRTDFVVELPKAGTLDRLTFLNENSAARGELKIAVSDQRLKADSTGWVEVEGIVPFSHKRLFGVSLIGIEAKFVRLSFHVDKAGPIGTVQPERENVAAVASPAAQKDEPFSEATLRAVVDGSLAMEHGRDGFLSASVQPLVLGRR